VLKVIIEENLYDKQFVTGCTLGLKSWLER